MTLALSPIHLLRFASTEDRDEFHSYPADEQASVKALHDAMMRIAAAPNPHQGCAAVANCRSGWKAKTLRKTYDAWKDNDRDWRVLVDKRKYPDAREPALPAEFRTFLGQRLSGNQRKNKPAYRQIIRQWQRWLESGDPRHAIPGYAECPPPGPCARYPHGWSYKNLNRHALAPAVVEIIRYGTQAGRAILPHIPGTREGLRWMEWVSGDDVWLDVKTHVPGCGPCRVLQFGFYEKSCSYYLENCFRQRPRTPRNDGTWEQLKQVDFLHAVAQLLEENGWPLDWRMYLLCENGTATMSRAQAQWLHEISEGQVIVGFNSMEGEFIAGWQEGKRGNSHAKAGHEGYHSILKNEMAHLIGQTGKDPEHAPMLDYGRDQQARKLDNLIVQLPPEARAQIITNYLPMPRIWQETFDALGRIHANADHACEGFERVYEWRPRGFAALPRPMAELQTWLAPMPHVNDDNLVEYVEIFERWETRAERKARLSAQGRFLAPPPAAMVPFYEDRCEMKRIRADYSFEFMREGRTYRFVPPTPADRLPVGEKVVGFYRPDGEVIHLFSGADGKNRRYLLSWPSEKKLRHDADPAVRGQFFRRREQHFTHDYEIATRATQPQIDAARAAEEQNAITFAAHGLLPANVQRGGTDSTAAVQSVVQTRESAAKATRQKRQDDAAAGKRLAKQRAAAAERARALLSSTPVE